MPVLGLIMAACHSGQGNLPEPEAEAGFQLRRAVLINQVADAYQPTDYTDRGKYSFPVVMARMEKHGVADARAAAYIEEYAGGRYGFFHFPFVGLARILGKYPEAPAVQAHRGEFLTAILQHDPEFHYNALTGEGTENHVNMSRTSGYLFAEQAAAIPELAEEAAQWRAQLKPWLLQWARRAYHYGTGEWDSSVYTAYNLIGWLNLYDFAQDGEVRAAARAVLDYYAANIALKYTQGLYSGPESRAPLACGPLPGTATEFLGWLWFGPDQADVPEGFFRSKEFIQSMHAATSGYRPPAALLALARKERIATPALYRLAKPDYLMTRAGQSQETYLIDESFTAGTVQAPYGGWANSSYGVINWKMVLRNQAGLPGVVTGNGGMRSTVSARGRNPFDQFLQHGATVVQMTRVPAGAEAIQARIRELVDEWKADFDKDFQTRWHTAHSSPKGVISAQDSIDLAGANRSLVYFPREAEVEIHAGWVFIAFAQTYLAAHSLGRDIPELRAGVMVDDAPRDSVAGFVIEAANAAGHASFAAFQEAVLARRRLARDADDVLKFHYTTLAGEELAFRFSDTGSWDELIVDWGYGVTDQQVGFNETRWRQPEWPSGKDQGRIPEAWVDGVRTAVLPEGTIIDGPQLRLAGGVLEIIGRDGSVYRADYQGELPVVAE